MPKPSAPRAVPTITTTPTTMSTLTLEQEQSIRDLLATMPHLARGVGSKESACSVAAWNLALTGTLTDTVPDCASRVIGRWAIGVQDACPPEYGRDHPTWRAVLPLAAGTGRAHEAERSAIVMDWMWGTVLPHLQPLADRRGFGGAWGTMCRERTAESANRAKRAAAAYADAYAVAYAADAYVAGAYAAVAYAVAYAADAYVAYAADAYAVNAVNAVNAAAYTASAAGVARKDAWRTFDVPALLCRLVAVTDDRASALLAAHVIA